MSARPPTCRRRTASIALFAAVTIAMVVPPGLAGQEPAERGLNERAITESERRLDEMRREQAALRDEMTRIRSRVTDLTSELSNLERQVVTAERMLEELDFQVAQREAQIAENTVDLLRTRDVLTERRAVLHRRLRDIYKRGPMSTVRVLLAAESFSELINRYRYLYLVARYDRTLAEEVASLERQLVMRERALRSDLAQLAAVRANRAREHEELAMLQADQRLALGGARNRQTLAARRIAELERNESGLSEMVATLGRADEGQPAGGPTLAGIPRGVLDWPVAGRLLYGFGPVAGPDGTVLRWSGIGIAAPAGSPVRAVGGGTIAVAGPFDGYGPTVVIDHGDGYHSLYLYLRDVEVREGQSVERGAEIGTVGGPAAGEGPHIEFQIRTPGGTAVDPIEWLRPR